MTGPNADRLIYEQVLLYNGNFDLSISHVKIAEMLGNMDNW